MVRVRFVTMLEWIATAAGILCVVLVVRRSLWNYPFAILSVSLFAIVFLSLIHI